jgi:hypothetical protein
VEAPELLDRFEHRSEPLLPARHFFGRVARFSALAVGVIAGALALGAAGYHWLASLFSGIAFVSTIALLFAPLIHRFFHALHVEDPTDEQRADLDG